MRIPLIYGLGIAFATSVVALISHLAGYSTELDKLIIGMLVGVAGSIVINATGLTLGARRARAENSAEGFGYGRAFAICMLIVIFAALGNLVFNFIYFKFLSPDFAEIQLAAAQSMMERMKMPPDKMDLALADMRAKSTLSRQLASGLIGTIAFGALVSLVVAAFVKRSTPSPGDLPPAFT